MTTIPKCEKCGAELERREPATYEQRYCGEWFDHPIGPSGSLFGHTGTMLFASEDLSKVGTTINALLGGGK